MNKNKESYNNNEYISESISNQECSFCPPDGDCSKCPKSKICDSDYEL